MQILHSISLQYLALVKQLSPDWLMVMELRGPLRHSADPGDSW